MKSKKLFRRWAVLLLMGTLLGCASSPRVPGSLRGIVKENKSDAPSSHVLKTQGYDYYLKGDFYKAITQIETYLMLYPKEKETWLSYVLYYCHMAVGNYPQALKVAKALVKEHPFVSLAYEQVGMAQLWLGRITKAAQNFSRATKFKVHQPRAYYYLGLARAKQGRKNQRDQAFEKAEQEYKAILKNQKEQFTANFEYASLLLYWKKALDQVTPLIAMAKEGLDDAEDLPFPKKFYEEYYLPVLDGIVLHHRGDAYGSLRLLLDSIAKAPAPTTAGMAQVYYFVGENYRALGDAENSKVFLKRAIAVDPNGIYSGKAKRALRR